MRYGRRAGSGGGGERVGLEDGSSEAQEAGRRGAGRRGVGSEEFGCRSGHVGIASVSSTLIITF